MQVEVGPEGVWFIVADSRVRLSRMTSEPKPYVLGKWVSWPEERLRGFSWGTSKPFPSMFLTKAWTFSRGERVSSTGMPGMGFP